MWCMASNFNPDQPRGIPKNKGSWAANDNGAPETALDNSAAETLFSKLGDGRNLLGESLSPETRARVFAAVDDPSWKNWDDAKSIVITPKRTLWQLTLEHTEYNVRSYPSHAADREAIGVHAPTREQILTALEKGALPITGDKPATLSDGTPLLVPHAFEHTFRGVTRNGHLVVVDEEVSLPDAPDFLVALTPCCNARARNYDEGPECSSCYQDVPEYLASATSATDYVRGAVN